MEAVADDVNEARKALGFDRVAVVGHSMQALMALEYAKKYPEHVSRVIMIAMSPRWDRKTVAEYWQVNASEDRKDLLARNLKKLATDTVGLSPSDAFIRWYVANGPQIWYDPRYDGSSIWEGAYVHVDLLNQMVGRVLPSYEVRKDLERVKMPVFLALGRYDFLAPYQLWEEVRRDFSDLTTHLFERSGHHPYLEEQALFDEKLIAWLKTTAQDRE